jgi:hypothetical protein
VKCLRGASALDSELGRVRHGDVKVFVVWEPVLASDWAPPVAGALARIPDSRVTQFWDRRRALSQAIRAAGDERVLGARRLQGDIVWDYVAVFPPGVRWEDRYPMPEYAGAPVLDVVEEVRPHLAAP